eukprot:4374280-Prymnesium_polylepis.1
MRYAQSNMLMVKPYMRSFECSGAGHTSCGACARPGGGAITSIPSSSFSVVDVWSCSIVSVLAHHLRSPGLQSLHAESPCALNHLAAASNPGVRLPYKQSTVPLRPNSAYDRASIPHGHGRHPTCACLAASRRVARCRRLT